MPQEAPGLNTVFDVDRSTLQVLADHFGRMKDLSRRQPRPPAAPGKTSPETR